ncbi:MAG: type II toxin-antitoxin system VapC family toxin [Methylocystis sp.]
MSGVKFLLDTNVVIGVLGGDEASGALIEQNGASLDLCAISQITRMELLSFPALTADAEAQIHRLLSALPVFYLDESVERAAIGLRRRARVKLPDAIILATAQINGVLLLTLDERLQRLAAGQPS